MNLKTPFDRNVVTQFEHQETLLDYGFAHLGLDSEGEVNHPVVMTEPLGNPNTCRACKYTEYFLKVLSFLKMLRLGQDFLWK